MKRLITTLLLSLTAALALGAAATAPRLESMPPVPFKSVTGAEIPVGQGGVTEIVFVARWCRPCEPSIAQVRRQLGVLQRSGYSAVIVGIARRQNQDMFTEWAASLGVRRNLVFDADGQLEKAYGVSLLPWHVVVGREGQILHSESTPPELEALREWLKQ